MSFFSLGPDEVLAAVEQAGCRTTGLCYPLNSLENRVYEVELEDSRRVIAKFYRPGRWSRECILDEHRLLARLCEAEIPVCAPTPFPDGETLHATQAGIHFALFPRTGGRSPDELGPEDYGQLGRLLARIHNVAAAMPAPHRPELSPASYGTAALAEIHARCRLPPGLRERYTGAVEALVKLGEARFRGAERFLLHADCHRANLLRGRDGWFFLDFDDAAVGPAVQDLWLLLPARPAECPRELDALVEGYQVFRPFDRASLGLVEVLRGLRYVRYAAWIATRWEDPAFPRAFPHFGSDSYWEGQYVDVAEQVRLGAGG